MSDSLQINGVSLSTQKSRVFKNNKLTTTSKYFNKSEKNSNQIYLKMFTKKKNQSLHPLNFLWQRLLIHPNSYVDSNSNYKGINPNFDLAFDKYKKYQNVFTSSGKINELNSLPKLPALSNSYSVHNILSLPAIFRSKIINPTTMLRSKQIPSYNEQDYSVGSEGYEKVKYINITKKNSQSKAIQCNMNYNIEKERYSNDMYKSIDDYNKLIQNRKLILIDDHDIKYSNIKMNKTEQKNLF